MKKIIPSLVVIFALGLTGISLAGKSHEHHGSSGDMKTASQFTAMRAKVVSVDKKGRRITLEGADGERVTVKVDERVKNFKQIKKGDWVKVQYQESIAWELKKRGKNEELTKTTTSTVTAAKPGEKPGMTRTNRIDAVVVVTAIDKKKKWVTLKGPEGNSLTVKVRDPKNLKGVKVGDHVFVSYTESLAMSVEEEN